MRGLPQARFVAGTAALGLALAACGGDGGGGTPNAGGTPGGGAGGGTYSIQISEPQDLVPTNTAETSGSEVLDALFTPLVTYKPDTNEPMLTQLAESIDSPDAKNWTIRIKPGWKFHNGEDVTAQSFVDAWNYGALATNGQQNSYFFQQLGVKGFSDVSPEDPNPEDDKVPTPKAKTMSGLKVVSPTEFRVTLDQPNNVFKSALGYTAFYPLPKAALKDMKAFEEAPIGNGPFKMKGKWEHNRKISVERFEDYQGTKPKAAGIDFKIYQSIETAYNDLRAGNLDVMDSLPPSALAGAKAELGPRYQEFPSSYYGFLGIPVFDERFKNVKVRQAVSMAIDRDAIGKTIFAGTRVPADAFVGPVVEGYRKGACGEICTFNPERAKQLLQEGGGLSDMTITYNADGGHKEWTEAACNQIKQNLGVKCQAVSKPAFDVLLDDLSKAQKDKKGFGPFRLGWIMDYPSMQNYLGPLYGTGGGSNYYGYSNKKFDNLVADGLKEQDPAKAIQLWQQAEDILVQDLPAIPLFFGQTQSAHSEKVSNVRIDAFDRIDKVAVEVKQ
ncbi:MAG: ABC transporter substrate-binding protein [Actinomycetota bacterium]|nr:ABC transporter substrate-binding protein [Actinomycetota bacterium]